MIDFERFEMSPLVREPFDHLVVREFLRREAVGSIVSGFPRIEGGGSYPPSELTFGSAFAELLDELRGPTLRALVERKFGLDLEGRPTLVTVRGQARKKDGRIHTDTLTKIVTLLLYLNPGWTEEGGRLRLLRSPASLDEYFAEIPPEAGTAVFFRCTDNAWHGHTPFAGDRRAIQLNWVTDEAVVRREERRHAFSAQLKEWWRG